MSQVKLTPQQHSFANGEISPKTAARSDLAIYATAAARMRNLIPLPQGPAMRRTGTRFVHAAKNSTAASRLIPFVFGLDQAYVLEFASGKMRVYANEGFVQAGSNTWAAANVSVANDTITVDHPNTHGYADSQGPFRLVDGGAGLPTGLNAVTDYYIKTVVGDPRTFQLSLTPGGAAINITAAGGNGNSIIPKPATEVIAEIDSPYQQADLVDIRWVQTADLMILVHPNYWPQSLSRFANERWLIARYETDGPYMDALQIDEVTFAPGSRVSPVGTTATTAGAFNVVGGAMTVTMSNPVFLAGRDEGRIIFVDRAGGALAADEGIFRITSVASTTVANCVTIRASTNGGLSVEPWFLGAWWVANYPRAISFFQQRLYFGGQARESQRIDASSPGDFRRMVAFDYPVFDTYVGTVTDFDWPFNFIISSDQVNGILWMRQGRTLLIGTAEGVYPLQASSQYEPVSPTNVNTFRSNAAGSAKIDPVIVGDAFIFLSDNERKLFEIQLSLDITSEAFAANEISLLADHLFASGSIDIAYAHTPHSLVHVLLEDGRIVSLTRIKAEKVAGFHLLTLGGQFGIRNFVAGDVDTANDRITITGHSYEELFGPVQFTNTGGALPGGIDAGVNYYVHVFSANVIELYRWPLATATKINITSAGSGTHTLTPVDSQPRIESITVIRSPDLSYDQLWAEVRRTINGATVRYLEFFEEDFDFPKPEELADAYFVDCGLSLLSNTAVTVISGLAHLEGVAVAVLADGVVVTGLTVSGGQITLPQAARQIHVGISYTSLLETLRIDPALRIGGVAGREKALTHATVRVTRSLELEIGTEEAFLETVLLREAVDEDSATPPLFTGDQRANLGAQLDRERRAIIRLSKPIPLMLNGLMLEADINSL